jgi:hypothetical protein
MSRAKSSPRLSVDPTRTCIDCGGSVSTQSKTGRCHRCACLHNNRDREIRARAGRSLSQTYASNPEVRQRHTEACRRANARRMADPEQVEQCRRQGRKVAALQYVANRTPEQRARDVQAQVRAAVPWCPPEHLALNRELKRKGIPLPERRRIILEMVPGTPEHTRRTIENTTAAQRIRQERERAQAY